MPRATKEELEWAYAVTREKFLERVNKMFPLKADDWNRYLDGIFELISNDEAPSLSSVQIKTAKTQKHLYCPVFTRKSPETTGFRDFFFFCF